MTITQMGKQLGKNLELELTLLFASMGDSHLPESAHTPPVKVDTLPALENLAIIGEPQSDQEAPLAH